MAQISAKMVDQLILEGEAKDIADIVKSAYFRISIKRYVDLVLQSSIIFQRDLSYLTLKKILSVLGGKLAERGVDFVIEPSVTEYIAHREMYLDTRYKLGTEIKKRDPKLQEGFCSFCAVVNSNMTRQLRERQLWDAFFMATMKKSSNFSVPGSGKTSSVYGMFAYLEAQNLAKRIVVICPKNAFAPWIDEFAVCYGDKKELHLFNIHNENYHSANQRRAAIQYESGACNLLLFNYESIKTYQKEITDLMDDKTILVFDEVHKVKRIDGEYAKAALGIARSATYVVAMTGTPIPNSYMDIYNLLHILYFEEYEEFFGFHVNALKNPDESERETINHKIQPFFCRTTKDELNVPKPNSDSIIPVMASSPEAEVFQILLKKYKKSKLLLMLRILQLESDSKQLLSAINLADYQYILDDDLPVEEIDYVDYSQKVVELIKSCGTSSKTTQCVNLVKGLAVQKKPVIVWCIFVKTIRNLAAVLSAEGLKVKCVYGEVELNERQSIINDFKQGKFDVLITNPNTLAESVSLHTVCHDAVYFEYSFNLVHLLQSKDRIHRLGLAQDQYTQFYFFEEMYPIPDGHYSMGEQIYERLMAKERIMLQAIENDELEEMPTTEEELDLIFNQLGL